MAGTRSLDSYVIQAIALVVVPIHIAHRPWNTVTMDAVALLVFAACWGWAEFRYFAHVDKLHKLPLRMVRLVRPHRPDIVLGPEPGVPTPESSDVTREPGPVVDDLPGVDRTGTAGDGPERDGPVRAGTAPAGTRATEPMGVHP